jgi:pimeloyl-ACP methyl ester carboxylesterase
MAARVDVTLPNEIAAWLWRPDGATGCVVMGHGFGAVRDQRLPAYAERFAAAGLGVLLFDYRHFGASGGEPRQLLDIGEQLDDWRVAVAYAHRDFERVGLFGSSFGGGHVLAIAAGNHDVSAVVAQCPMTDGLKAALRTPPKTTLRLGRVAFQDELGSRLGRQPKLIKAAGRPGELAVMSSPDTLPGFESLTPPDSTWVNLVAARVALRVALYRPGRKAAEIACPLLVCVCEHDSLVSVEAAAKVAQDAPQGELVRYPVGHFEIYTGEWFERVVTRQTEFLARHLSASPG